MYDRSYSYSLTFPSCSLFMFAWRFIFEYCVFTRCICVWNCDCSCLRANQNNVQNGQSVFSPSSISSVLNVPFAKPPNWMGLLQTALKFNYVLFKMPKAIIKCDFFARFIFTCLDSVWLLCGLLVSCFAVSSDTLAFKAWFKRQLETKIETRYQYGAQSEQTKSIFNKTCIESRCVFLKSKTKTKKKAHEHNWAFFVS